MIVEFPVPRVTIPSNVSEPRPAEASGPCPADASGPCPHRSVSDDGRVLCEKIVDQNNAVSPQVCRDCQFRVIDCSHLRFTLSLSSTTPLMVRCNGRTEVWDDGPPKVALDRAACVAKVSQIEHPAVCAGCSRRLPVLSGGEQVIPKLPPVGSSKVIPFPSRAAMAATA
jgi:hypothetical protein